MASAPTTFDPLRGGPGDAEVAALVFDTPFVVDADGKPRPSLALALDNPDGGLRARLVLRPERALLRRHAAHRARRRRLAHPRAARSRRLDAGADRAARAIGDQTVELELSRPTPELALLLSTPAAMVTPDGMRSGEAAHRLRPLRRRGSDGAGVRLGGQRRLLRRPRLPAVAALRAFPARSDEAGSYEVGALQAIAPPARRARRHRPAPRRRHRRRAADAHRLRRRRPHRRRRRGAARARARHQPRAAAPPDRARAGLPSSRRAYESGARQERSRAPLGATARPKLALLVDASRFDNRDVAERILADLARAGIERQHRRRRRGDLPGARRRRPLRAPPRPGGAAGARRHARRARARRRRRSRRRARRAATRRRRRRRSRGHARRPALHARRPPVRRSRAARSRASTAPAAPPGPTPTGSPIEAPRVAIECSRCVVAVRRRRRRAQIFNVQPLLDKQSARRLLRRRRGLARLAHAATPR